MRMNHKFPILGKHIAKDILEAYTDLEDWSSDSPSIADKVIGSLKCTDVAADIISTFVNKGRITDEAAVILFQHRSIELSFTKDLHKLVELPLDMATVSVSFSNKNITIYPTEALDDGRVFFVRIPYSDIKNYV